MDPSQHLAALIQGTGGHGADGSAEERSCGSSDPARPRTSIPKIHSRNECL